MRKPRPLNREIKHVRDTNLIIIATEGERTEPLYFYMDCFTNKRIQVKVLPTEDGHSSPKAVLDRLHKEAEEYQYGEGDQFWLVMDRDSQSWTDEEVHRVTKECTESGYRIAMSNPCFELWLLLHFQDFNTENESLSCNHIKDILKPILNDLSEDSYDNLYCEHINLAIERAKKLDIDPLSPIPNCPVTRIHLLVQEFLI